ncbi:YgeY family selenium metabolism-linked hydrolase [Chloroflexota bacterium]
MNPSDLIPKVMQKGIIQLTQDLIRIPSVSGNEKEIIHFLKQKMVDLGFKNVTIDEMGNLIGKMGDGKHSILFDSHVDTVDVKDEDQWAIPPFNGELINGTLHGRGSVDMKSGTAASIYAVVLAASLGWIKDLSVYVSCTVIEEDCDGENLKHLFNELNLKPEMVIICEPSMNQICLGHKGKAQISIRTGGVSAHGSAPEKGVNAIYEMAEIIHRVEKRNLELMKLPIPRPTLVLSRISSSSASLNAVPSECEITLDRRIIPGESMESIRQEMDNLIDGKNASWEIGTVHRKSWTGKEIVYKPLHPAWKIEMGHTLTQACRIAYQETFGSKADRFAFWDFSTNAVTPVSMGIPTIGFGPGEYKQAHMRDEHIAIEDILNACCYYTQLIKQLDSQH